MFVGHWCKIEGMHSGQTDRQTDTHRDLYIGPMDKHSETDIGKIT